MSITALSTLSMLAHSVPLQRHICLCEDSDSVFRTYSATCKNLYVHPCTFCQPSEVRLHEDGVGMRGVTICFANAHECMLVLNAGCDEWDCMHNELMNVCECCRIDHTLNANRLECSPPRECCPNAVRARCRAQPRCAGVRMHVECGHVP